MEDWKEKKAYRAASNHHNSFKAHPVLIMIYRWISEYTTAVANHMHGIAIFCFDRKTMEDTEPLAGCARGQ